MERTVRLPQRQTNVRRGIEAAAIAGNNPDDVAASQFALDRSHPVFWDLIERPTRDTRLHLSQRPEQRFIMSEVTVMAPAHRHFSRGMRHTRSAQVMCQVLDETAPIVISE